METKQTKRSRRKAECAERPIAEDYPVIDTDLARDNLENDLAFADFQDL